MAQTGLVPNDKTTGFEAAKTELKPEDTVAGRVTDLLKADSPLIQQARTNSLQQMNTRGLINSSMAIGEGEKAAAAAALPIASQDATASVNTKLQNTAAENVSRQSGATAENQRGLQELQGTQSLDLATLQGQNQKDIANIEATYKTTMQANDSAARFFSQTSSSISDILKEPNISVEAKQQLVQKQVDLLKNGLAVIGGISNLDLGSLLTFDTTTPGALQPTPAAGSPAAIAEATAAEKAAAEAANAKYQEEQRRKEEQARIDEIGRANG